MIKAVGAAWQTLAKLAGLLGLSFKESAATGRAGAAASSDGAELVEKLMSLLIQLRQEARANKNFALSDAIRNRAERQRASFSKTGADGTIWRKT